MDKVRVGLYLNSAYNEEMPIWVYEMIRRIRQGHYADVALVIKDLNKSKKVEEEEEGRRRRLLKNRRTLLYFLYWKYELKYKNQLRNAFAPLPTADVLGDVPSIEITPTQKGFSDYVLLEDLATIRSYNLDVIIFFGSRILKGEILTITPYGVWSYHHGDNSVNRGYPACAWEFLLDWPITGSVLQILNEELDGGKLLYASHALTDDVSIQNNMNKVYWKTMSFAPRMLERLYRDRENFFKNEVEPLNSHPKSYSGRLYTVPTNTELIKALYRKYAKRVKNKISNLGTSNQWSLFFCFSHAAPALTLFKFKPITPPKDRFWADPHVIYKDNRYYIFIEEFIYSKNRGHISVIEMDGKGNYKPAVPVLEMDIHTSYPFTFEHEGKYYMIPETGERNTIELYESKNFPYSWERKMTLMENVKAVDVNVFYYNDKWWLFTNIRENEGATTLDELYVFYSDTLFSNSWTPHYRNPVISDVRLSRSGGQIFTENGKLYRVAQKSSPYYGWGVTLQHIKKLNEKEFEIEVVSTLSPDWNKQVKGSHTLSFANRLTVIDALVKRRG